MLLRSTILKKHEVVPRAVQLQINTQRQVGAYCRQTPHTIMDFNRQPSILPLDIIEDIIEQLKTMGTQKLTISGLGDPALHPDLKRVLQKSQIAGMETVLETTTLGLPTLLLTQAQVVRIPLWAFSLHHQTKMCPDLEKSCFLNMVNTLDELAERRKQKESVIPDVELVATLTAGNVSYLKELESLLSNNRVQRLRFRYVDKTTALNENEIPPAPTDPELEEAFTVLEKTCREYKILNNIKTFRKEGTHKKRQWHSSPCWVGYSFARINPYGEVRPCPHSRLIAGNIFETPSFETIWNSQRFHQFRTQMSLHLSHLGSQEECGACPYRTFNRKASASGFVNISALDLDA